ncbi:hypothetical protein [Roseateles asaccharophilus]|uniref:Uncharacterized protein n=1 Tax=Roseateles asaccharophilus TaxID=582607 RepID=A0ABU2AEN7_9BURK|nr:hypothetical protein [Roseateles asaccharophilus]MDR7335677.1 hypothetical protein [Roseateles asaccharophilus]
MSSLWPWLAVAGAGALHGLNPCSGWALAAACGWRERDERATLRALVPLALGHAVSVGVVAAAVALGLAMDALPLLAAAGVLGLVASLAWRRRRGTALALWSFIATTLQGSGLMLVPALVPLCLSASPAREITASGSLALALAAVAAHMAAMLTVMAVAAWVARRGADALWLR